MHALGKVAFRFVIILILITGATASGYSQNRTEPIPGIPLRKNKAVEFEHGISITAGYGFPNVDQSYLPQYYTYQKTNLGQSGPLTVSLNYHFNNEYSAGLLLTYGTTSASYFATADTVPLKNFKTKFSNNGILANFVRYFPQKSKLIPYSKIAIGVNFWKLQYTGDTESETPDFYTWFPVMAYQGAIGISYPFYKSVAGYAELGYGKYIVNAGLSFKF